MVCHARNCQIIISFLLPTVLNLSILLGYAGTYHMPSLMFPLSDFQLPLSLHFSSRRPKPSFSLPFLLITHIQYATYVHNLLMFHNEQLCAENATALHITVIWCKLIQTSSDISSEYTSPYSMQHVFRVLQFN